MDRPGAAPVAARWGLTGIGGVSGEDLCTVGRVMSTTSRGVALHWDGQHWQQRPVPTPDRQDAQLSDVVALASDDVWAAGHRSAVNAGGRARLPFAVHWDGTAWSLIHAPHEPRPGLPAGQPTARASLSVIVVWAVSPVRAHV